MKQKVESGHNPASVDPSVGSDALQTPTRSQERRNLHMEAKQSRAEADSHQIKNQVINDSDVLTSAREDSEYLVVFFE